MGERITTKPKHFDYTAAKQNRWLALLSRTEFDQLRPLFEVIDVKKGSVLWSSGDPRHYLYFPLTALIGLMHESQDGSVIEVGMVGQTGMAGVVTFMGDAKMPIRAIVHRKGTLCRIRSEDVDIEFAKNLGFRDICLYYTETLIGSLSVSVVCNRLHSIEQQTSKYLLTHHDNIDSEIIYVTHQEMSEMLGVQRKSVSIALIDLRNRGLIQTRRGEIVILDRKRMEKIVCECYSEIRSQHLQILKDYKKEHTTASKT